MAETIPISALSLSFVPRHITQTLPKLSERTGINPKNQIVRQIPAAAATIALAS